jgi:deferrochelatase/peroxidase EfeB
MAAHIRKAYPRDEVTVAVAEDSESDTQTHRLLRRGIPFGGSFGAAVGGGIHDPRGLLFQCYQRSIEDQFEFVQSQWVNNPRSGSYPVAGSPGGGFGGPMIGAMRLLM